ncbi:MAG: hypothetical protein ACRD2X_00095 [Vicinamibacteraceae bacterium]
MLKPQPNHKLYIEVLRSMGPEQRLRKAFELAAFGRELLRAGIRRRHPGLSDSEIDALVRDRVMQCHNQRTEAHH